MTPTPIPAPVTGRNSNRSPSAPERPLRARDRADPHVNAALEASLERYFRLRVRSLLRGRVIKIAPIEAGVPDRLVLLPGHPDEAGERRPGRVELVELKTATGRERAVQKLFRDRARELGIRVHIVRGREGVDAWIRNRIAESWEADNPEGPRSSLVTDAGDRE